MRPQSRPRRVAGRRIVMSLMRLPPRQIYARERIRSFSFAERWDNGSARRREERRCNFVHTQPEETRRWLRRAEASPPPRNERGLRARGAPAADVGGCARVHVHREARFPVTCSPATPLGYFWKARSGVNSEPINEYRWTLGVSRVKGSRFTQIALVLKITANSTRSLK